MICVVIHVAYGIKRDWNRWGKQCGLPLVLDGDATLDIIPYRTSAVLLLTLMASRLEDCDYFSERKGFLFSISHVSHYCVSVSDLLFAQDEGVGAT